MDDVASRLSRKLTTFDAVVIGLGAMIGAGIFAVLGPAAQLASSGLLPALFLAAALAFCNAFPGNSCRAGADCGELLWCEKYSGPLNQDHSLR